MTTKPTAKKHFFTLFMVFLLRFRKFVLDCALVTVRECDLLLAARAALNTSTNQFTQGFYHWQGKAQST